MQADVHAIDTTAYAVNAQNFAQSHFVKFTFFIFT